MRRDLEHNYGGELVISIHAPRMRCDVWRKYVDRQTDNFNPRTSYEMRPVLGKQTPVAFNDFNPRTSYEMRQILT